MEFLGIRLLRARGFYGKGLLVIESYGFQCFWGLAVFREFRVWDVYGLGFLGFRVFRVFSIVVFRDFWV